MKYLPQQVIFDLDDTLVHCNKYFDLILGQYFELMSEWFGEYGPTTGEFRSKQVEIDVETVSTSGLASDNFPKSLIATYRFFCAKYNRTADPYHEQQLMKLGLSVYDQEVEAYPGMVETLDALKHDGHNLYLYTGGDDTIQQRKIDQMKLGVYFDDRIFIRQHKNIESLENILMSHPFERKRTWMIGNSLRTDVLPALTAGINSIYLKQQNEWLYNLIELQREMQHSVMTISSISEVPPVIRTASKLKSHG
ncbi:MULTISPECIES: HAD family hydrolase [unclassified Paenibacillus]|uniref:HAD family hydrolase n=1 Tax=unclassified Paenibacillus TaxID=185978 RepID=UPI002405F672|nr:MULTISPECIES: HAD family hydrolase [unclassified Paenibacillus]MDF9841105.1 putative hydrolase of the HAD superfamily [Paenibacillus sp. PastF-2]MDF9847723.1 putative hydrolase of the HAD superfamily [Paenibacillus sp. PastM-2]MDF9854292.1 putative hydrolase of the HAD superfamily [Paenibacillus sp. PastF-1]MDH6479537.1 putative hydrolase of the HAD superfamily [Paenibacillus sp. PastH-2]MDH6505202.1 putative hydrolase of the HAD superfamily [Paenibacillus sp. PastM-3]